MGVIIFVMVRQGPKQSDIPVFSGFNGFYFYKRSKPTRNVSICIGFPALP